MSLLSAIGKFGRWIWQKTFGRKKILDRREVARILKEEEEPTFFIGVTVKHTKEPQLMPMYQLGVVFDLVDEKTGEIQTGIEGWSRVYSVQDYEVMFNEAMRYAQAIAGGSNWVIEEVVSREWIEYA